MNGIFLGIAFLLMAISSVQFGNSIIREDAFGGYATLLFLIQISAGLIITFFVAYNMQIDRSIHNNVKAILKTSKTNASEKQTLSFRLIGILLCFLSFLMFGSWISYSESGNVFQFVNKILLYRVFDWGTTEVVSTKFQAPLTVLLGTSVVLMFVSLSVGVLCTALYVALSSPKTKSIRAVFAGLIHFLGSVPFIIPLLIFRVVYYSPVQAQSIIRRVETVSSKYNYIAMEGISIGLFSAGFFLGLTIASSMWKWLDSVEGGIKNSAAGQLGFLNNRTLRSQLFREGLWIGAKQELLQRLLVGVAAASLIDIVSGSVLDTFYFNNLKSGASTFPLYPSLGTVLYLGDPQALNQSINPWLVSFVMVLLMLQLLFAALPEMSRAPWIRTYSPDDSPNVRNGKKKYTVMGFGDLMLPNNKKLTSNVTIKPGWTPYKGINYVLGESGTGKTTYLRALQSRFIKESVPLYQDPDTCLPKDMSVYEVFALVCKNNPTKEQNLIHILELTKDERLRTACDDPYTPVFRLSRGERQRFAFALAWSRILDDLGLDFDQSDKKNPRFTKQAQKESPFFVYMDEFTSAQDAFRSDTMWRIVQQTIDALCAPDKQHFFIATHDPESLKSSKWDKKAITPETEEEWENRTLWFGYDEEEAPKMSIKYLCEKTEKEEGEPTFLTFRQALRALEEYDTHTNQYEKKLKTIKRKPGAPIGLKSFAKQKDLGDKRALRMGPNYLQAPQNFTIAAGTVNILKGPSGTGKSTLLAHLRNSSVNNSKYVVGWIPQDPSRAFPPNMLTLEALALVSAQESEFTRAAELFGSPTLTNDADFWTKPVRSLSEGQRQRVAIVRELLRLEREAKAHEKFIILMLDEPFGSLDPANHIRIMRELLDWMEERNKDKGKCSMIIISHTPKLEKEISRGLDLVLPPEYADKNKLPPNKGFPVRTWEIVAKGLSSQEPEEHGSTQEQIRNKQWKTYSFDQSQET